MLSNGSSGAEVEALQRKLIAKGVNPGPIDGVFGPKTEEAVRRFQEQQGLQVDGIAGPNTLGALGLGEDETPPAAARDDSGGSQPF